MKKIHNTLFFTFIIIINEYTRDLWDKKYNLDNY